MCCAVRTDLMCCAEFPPVCRWYANMFSFSSARLCVRFFCLFFFFFSQPPAERVEEEGEGEHLPARRLAFSSSSQWRGERRRAAGSFTSTDAEIHSCAAAAVMDHSRDLLFFSFFSLSVNDPSYCGYSTWRTVGF